MKPVSKKEWLLWIPTLIIPILIVLTLGFNVSEFSKAGVLAITALCVAINEEVIFRGALVKGFLRFGTTVTIFVPAVLFGIIHLGNIFGGADITFSVYQAGWAIAAGIAYTALRLRNQSIYPLIVFHFILDYTEYLSTGENGVHQTGFSTRALVIGLIVSVLFAIYALVLFKMSKKTIITEMSIES
nr:CPBP family intramembrane glutamic endopeptidase [Lederbergia citrea]